MKRKSIVITAILVVLQLCSSLWALPTTAYEAVMAVAGWLKVDPQPLETALGQEIMSVETFTDNNGEPVYYVVYLEPSGFVIVSGDDLVEPIIGFADDGIYDPSLDNPLGALVTNDLNVRISAVRSTFRLLAMTPQTAISDTQKKWNLFIGSAVTSEGGFGLMGRQSISDVRVAPLVQSKWDQTTVCDRNCYNYYTPNHYPSGCVATAMAQLMRFHQYPIEPDDSVPYSVFERQRFTITVNGNNETRYLKGGNGSGGPYNWNRMELIPDCSTTLSQRQAIGALCYDAGISINMDYTPDGSGALVYQAKEVLLTTFQYENAISGWNYDYFTETYRDLGSGLKGMINPNLDAGLPVILSLRRDGADGGHTVLADGYGYNFSTPYHHLNMGWSGSDDAYYNLPNVDSNPPYDVIDECVYNIFTSGSGEIISGRVTDAFGNPVRGAKVSTVPISIFYRSYSDETNDKGIYALKGLDSNTMYTLTVDKIGYNFEDKRVSTGTSSDGNATSGNRWGINFRTTPFPPDSALIGWWKLDEGSGNIAADASGRDMYGVLVSDPVWREDGVHKGCLFFDGDQAHVRTTHQDSLNPAAGSFTVAFWAYLEPAPGTRGGTNWDLAVAKRDAGSAGYYIGANRNQGSANQSGYRFMLGDTDANRKDTAYVAVPLGEWIFVAAVLDRDRNAQKISVDGGQTWATTTPPPGPIAPAQDLGIGWDIGQDNYWFHGRIDDVRLYNRPLSTEEILLVMEGGGDRAL